MTEGEALADIEQALAQRGFLPCSGEFPTFGGTIPCSNRVVRLALSFPCLRFTRLPIALLTHRAEDMPGALAHIEADDRLCYSAPGFIVLDMHAPGSNALTVLELIEKVLGEVTTDLAQFQIAAEFPQHWLAVLTARIALPPDAPEGVASLIVRERLGAAPLRIVARKSKDGQYDGGAMGPLAGPAAQSVWVGSTNRQLHLAGRTTPPSNLDEFLAWMRDVDPALAARAAKAIEANFFGEPSHILIQGPNGCVGGRLDPPALWKLAATTHGWWARMLRGHPSKVAFLRWRGVRMDAAYARVRNLTGGPSLVGRDIALIGCGTIGSHLARFLVQSGAGDGGRLLLVDSDILDAGNLGRHWLGAAHIGSSKAKACAAELKKQSPGVEVHALAEDVMNRLDLLARYSLVIDATGEEALSRALNAEFLGRRPAAPDCLFVWLVGQGAAAQALFLPGSSDGRGCLACQRRHGEAPRVMRDGTNDEVIPAACGEAAFMPYGVAAPAIAAGLACRMALEWSGGSVSPSFRTLRVDLAGTAGLADCDVPRRADCPACRGVT